MQHPGAASRRMHVQETPAQTPEAALRLPPLAASRRFAYGVGHLLDYACGRGGDLHKWKAAKVRALQRGGVETGSRAAGACAQRTHALRSASDSRI